MTKGLINQKDIKISNVCRLNHNIFLQKMTELKEEIDKSTILVKNFMTRISVFDDITNNHKFNGLNNTNLLVSIPKFRNPK